MSEVKENILVPFPSSTDKSLRVSSLPCDFKVPILQCDLRGFDDCTVMDLLSMIPRYVNSEDTPEGIGRVSFSRSSIRKLRHSLGDYITLSERQAYLEIIPRISDVLKNSILIEEHRDRVKNTNGKRLPENRSDISILKIQRLFGAINVGEDLYRSKITLQVYQEDSDLGRNHGFEIVRIELFGPKTSSMKKSEADLPLPNSSISIANLLKDLELSYEPGVKIVDAMQSCHHFLKTGSRKMMFEVYQSAQDKLVRYSSILEEAEETLGKEWKENLRSKDDEQVSESKGLKL